MTPTIVNGLEFRIPFVPGSKKNNYRPRAQFLKSRKGLPMFDALKGQERAIKALLAAEMTKRGLHVLAKDRAVSVEVTVHEAKRIEDSYVTVYVFDVGKRPGTGRRGIPSDLDGVQTTILDCLQGTVITNDYQATKLHAVRRFPGEPAEPWLPTPAEIERAAGATP